MSFLEYCAVRVVSGFIASSVLRCWDLWTRWTEWTRWPVTKADNEWQPIAFLLGYSQKYGTSELPTFKYEVCTKTATPAYAEYVTTRCEDDFHRLASFARLAESMIAAEHFIPNEQGFYCGSCPHQDACKAWHRDQARGSVRVAA